MAEQPSYGPIGSQMPTRLEGQMLISMPGIGDPRFERSVIFICAHNEEGAMGLIVNKVAEEIDFKDLVEQLELLPPESYDPATLNRNRLGPGDGMPGGVPNLPVHFGGPVEVGRGFVLHSHDYFRSESSMPISNDIAMTATLDIVRAIARQNGPKNALFALGYAGWGPGQLEEEISDNGWLHCDADEDLVFGGSEVDKYLRAMQKIGIDPSLLSGSAGHA